MGAKTPEGTDLFGDAYEPLKDRRGRKSLRFGVEAHEKVRVLRALGMDQEEIAEAMDLSVPTLTKYFFRDLKVARSKVKASALVAIFRSAMDGKGSAQGRLLELLAAALAEQQPQAYTAPAAREPKLGKKEQRQATADGVGGMYAPGAPPASLRH